MPSLSLRLGKTLNQYYQKYCQTTLSAMTKSQAVQYVLVKYMEQPEIFSVLDVRELREPMEVSMSITVPEELQAQLTAFADQRQLKVSEVIRMAIYRELILHGDP